MIEDFSSWKQFEVDATNYLNRNFSDAASFEHQGDSDSTVPDIFVSTHNGSFYIEAKKCPSQCGQFVLMPDTKNSKFEYSHQNKYPNNKYAQIIINFMNRHFSEFKDAGTSGKEIAFFGCKDIFAKWIKTAYANKGIKFIITNEFKLLLLEDISKAFDITAKFRIKRSGSRSPNQNDNEVIAKYINAEHYIDNFIITQDKRAFVRANENLDNKRFYIDKDEFMFSKKETGIFEVRKLSNTFNSNVIFELKLKPGFYGLTKHEMKQLLLSTPIDGSFPS